ncbi:MAG TPA: ABC transporter ATP-binding protein [Anaerolineae bacterium]|nr:ABC transporter ATP-binding protein [Anaerolineae bacterium]
MASSITIPQDKPEKAVNHLLDVQGLKTYFFTDEGIVKAVDGLDLKVRRGEIFGLVGESGCGKTVTALSILRLIPKPGRIVEGEIFFDNQAILKLSDREMRQLRGNRISMIFQEPLMSLNPVFTIGSQVAEVLQLHQGLDKETAWEQAINLLDQVEIPDPSDKARSYPHEISGGQAQRVMIATALALDPQLLITDEPTTALDVTIQAQILDLIRELSRDRNTSVILITHDLGVVAEMCHRVAVMYAGRIVEEADVGFFDRPMHPYTQGLIASIPIPGEVKNRLPTIQGNVPDLMGMPDQCRFAERCEARTDYNLNICTEIEPDLRQIHPNHAVRCWLFQSHEDHQAPLIVTEAGVIKRVVS